MKTALETSLTVDNEGNKCVDVMNINSSVKEKSDSSVKVANLDSNQVMCDKNVELVNMKCEKVGTRRDLLEIHEIVKKSKLPNYAGEKIPVPSNINTEFMKQNLVDYEDKKIVDLMEYGAPIGYVGQKKGQNTHINHSGARLFHLDL